MNETRESFGIPSGYGGWRLIVMWKDSHGRTISAERAVSTSHAVSAVDETAAVVFEAETAIKAVRELRDRDET